MVTGQRIPVAVPPTEASPADEAGLICVPAFCAGVSGLRVTYLVRPDGSGRVDTPAWSNWCTIAALGDGGRLECQSGGYVVVYDPVSGRAGRLPGTGGIDYGEAITTWYASDKLVPGDLVWGLVIAQTK